MKSIFNYYGDNEIEKMFLEEYSAILAEEVINESFKSTLLLNIAKKISQYEKESNKRRVENAKRLDKEYGTKYGKHDPEVVGFTSIFGPVVTKERGSSDVNRIKSLKWSEITDEQFEKYDSKDKNLHKIVKNAYNGKEKANFILCKKETKEPMIFVKVFGTEANDQKVHPIVYTFASGVYKYGGESENERKWSKLETITKSKYSYQHRNLKDVELIDIMKEMDCDVYVLKVTDKLIDDYKDITKSRKEAQAGVINYDEDSLKRLLDKQRARYKTLIKQMKAERLMKDPNGLFNEIKKINDDVVQLYKEVLENPENFDRRPYLGRVMDDVSRAYNSFMEYAKNMREYERAQEYAKKQGQDLSRYSQMDKERAESDLRDVEEYIKSIKKQIEDLRNELV